MKIAVLTFFNYTNYGAALQSYALYKTLSDMGHDVEYLDYTCPYIGNPFKLNHLKKKGLFGYIYSTVGYICYLPRRSSFKKFREMIAHTKPLTYDTIRKMEDKYDKYIVGSDQVWSAKLTDFDKTYFLDFVKDDGKKYSYAASFGGSNIKKEDESTYNQLLNSFEKISVREEYGQEIVKNIADKESTIVLDPTLLLDETEWSKLCAETKEKNDYILVYQLGFSKQLIEAVNDVKKNSKMRVIYVPFPLGGFVKSKISLALSPSKWLTLFKNAKYVVTDSYHGIIFSIIFKRKFLAVVAGQHKNQRATALLGKLGLNDRIATSNYSEKIANEIDYLAVNKVLKKELQFSKQWLKENI